MSASDSEYSIDWLASDEDDCDSPKGLSPQHAVELPAPPPSSSSSSSLSSSTTSSRKSPTSSFCSGATKRRRSELWDCRAEGADSLVAPQGPVLSPLQGFTSVCTAQAVQNTRKRARSSGSDGFCERPDTENELFLNKCVELQCYIQPLSSILRGLRSGRYSEREYLIITFITAPRLTGKQGSCTRHVQIRQPTTNTSDQLSGHGLSSFQESVAMDRIQRIMGVIQNPNMGGRFVTFILKMEEMLHSWFPHIKPNQTGDDAPAKKQKLQQHRSSASPPPSPPVSVCSSDVEPAASYSSAHLKWLHTSSVCPLKTPKPTHSQTPASHLPTRCSHQVTQDNAVSSSTDSRTASRRRVGSNARLSQGQLPFKISSPCLERLLQAKESIITPRTVGGEGWISWLPADDS